MKNIDLSNAIAAEMNKIINSDEHKEMFGSSAMIEKLAFKKVSEEEVPTEVEIEVSQKLNKKASANVDIVKQSINQLLSISEVLDNAGFEKVAAASILLADKLISEAKAKKEKSSKSEKSKSSKKSEKDSKKSDKKNDVKERMKKMREMKGKSKKSTKTAQELHPMSFPAKQAPHGKEAEMIMESLPASLKGKVRVEVQFDTVKVSPGDYMPVVQNVVQKLQEANMMPSKSYKIVGID